MPYTKVAVKKRDNILLTPELKARCLKQAFLENRSFNNLIETAIKFYLSKMEIEKPTK